MFWLLEPKGHSAMDKALACHPSASVLNLVQSKDFSARFLSATPATYTLSHTMPFATCSSMNTCQLGGKKRGIMVKS